MHKSGTQKRSVPHTRQSYTAVPCRARSGHVGTHEHSSTSTRTGRVVSRRSMHLVYTAFLYLERYLNTRLCQHLRLVRACPWPLSALHPRPTTVQPEMRFASSSCSSCSSSSMERVRARLRIRAQPDDESVKRSPTGTNKPSGPIPRRSTLVRTWRCKYGHTQVFGTGPNSRTLAHFGRGPTLVTRVRDLLSTSLTVNRSGSHP